MIEFQKLQNKYLCIAYICTTVIYFSRKKDTDVYTRLLDSEGEGKGEGGMIWENGNYNMYTVM